MIAADLDMPIATFLADLRRTGRSQHTLRAYATELAHLSACHAGVVATITVETLRRVLARRDACLPASRARTMAALNSFLTWAMKHDLLTTNPLMKLDRVTVPDPPPRGVKRDQIDAVLKVIPHRH